MPAHILIVEDDNFLTTAVEDVLHIAGYRTTVCKKYGHIIECLIQNDVDLIILDGYLNEYDGRDICRQIKSDERFSNTPVVFASVMSSVDLKNVPADAFLPKPYGMYDLIKVIKSTLNNYNKQVY